MKSLLVFLLIFSTYCFGQFGTAIQNSKHSLMGPDGKINPQQRYFRIRYLYHLRRELVEAPGYGGGIKDKMAAEFGEDFLLANRMGLGFERGIFSLESDLLNLMAKVEAGETVTLDEFEKKWKFSPTETADILNYYIVKVLKMDKEVEERIGESAYFELLARHLDLAVEVKLEDDPVLKRRYKYYKRNLTLKSVPEMAKELSETEQTVRRQLSELRLSIRDAFEEKANSAQVARAKTKLSPHELEGINFKKVSLIEAIDTLLEKKVAIGKICDAFQVGDQAVAFYLNYKGRKWRDLNWQEFISWDRTTMSVEKMVASAYSSGIRIEEIRAHIASETPYGPSDRGYFTAASIQSKVCSLLETGEIHISKRRQPIREKTQAVVVEGFGELKTAKNHLVRPVVADYILRVGRNLDFDGNPSPAKARTVRIGLVAEILGVTRQTIEKGYGYLFGDRQSARSKIGSRKKRGRGNAKKGGQFCLKLQSTASDEARAAKRLELREQVLDQLKEWVDRFEKGEVETPTVERAQKFLGMSKDDLVGGRQSLESRHRALFDDSMDFWLSLKRRHDTFPIYRIHSPEKGSLDKKPHYTGVYRAYLRAEIFEEELRWMKRIAYYEAVFDLLVDNDKIKKKTIRAGESLRYTNYLAALMRDRNVSHQINREDAKEVVGKVKDEARRLIDPDGFDAIKWMNENFIPVPGSLFYAKSGPSSVFELSDFIPITPGKITRKRNLDPSRERFSVSAYESIPERVIETRRQLRRRGVKARLMDFSINLKSINGLDKIERVYMDVLKEDLIEAFWEECKKSGQFSLNKFHSTIMSKAFGKRRAEFFRLLKKKYREKGFKFIHYLKGKKDFDSRVHKYEGEAKSFILTELKKEVVELVFVWKRRSGNLNFDEAQLGDFATFFESETGWKLDSLFEGDELVEQYGYYEKEANKLRHGVGGIVTPYGSFCSDHLNGMVSEKK